MNQWSHLPNAKHIDRILESLKTNPDKWASVWKHNVAMEAAMGAAWDATRAAAYDAAWRMAAWDAARDAAMDAAMDAAWNAARNAARGAAQDAIIALIAYDECAYMLDSDLGELRMLAKLGDLRAILLLSAREVFNMEKENE